MPIFSLLFRTTSMSDIGVIKPQNSVILKWLKHGFLDFIISLIVSLTVLWIVTSILHQGKNIKSVENIKSIKNNIPNEISELKNEYTLILPVFMKQYLKSVQKRKKHNSTLIKSYFITIMKEASLICFSHKYN